jgi:hypothetical protein
MRFNLSTLRPIEVLSSLVIIFSMFAARASADTVVGDFEGVPDSALDWASGSQGR